MTNYLFNKFSIRFLNTCLFVFFTLVLTSCGGGSPTLVSGGGGGLGGGDVSGLSLNNIEIGSRSLSAGGSTGITVELKDESGNFSTDTQTVVFSSPCVSLGLAEIDTPITSSTGLFATTYTSKGCEGDDEITAIYATQRLSSVINNQPANLGSVEFISADPQSITLRGMSAPGQQSTSRIKFQIKNDVGGPVVDADVQFELTTDVGGIQLSVTEAKTDSEGFVSTVVQAGSVRTSVKVRATVIKDGVTISTESSKLVISTGIADQNSLSMSLSNHNPSAWEFDGEEVSISIIASDRYNNPVSDGTTIAFFTELGQVQPSCQTVNGKCSAIWTSAEPRDLGTLNSLYPRNLTTFNSDGITTVTAMVIGEESFIDSNSNGIFDDGDQFDLISDRGEAFEDYNQNYDTDNDGIADNAFDAGLDPFIDFNGNGVYDARDGKYTGLGCQHSSLCASGNDLKNIFVSQRIVMAEENLNIRVWQNGLGSSLVGTVVNGPVYTIEVFGIQNNQIPPSGTVITVVSNEADVVLGGATVPSSNDHLTDLTNPTGAYTLQMQLRGKDPEEVENGNVGIKIVTPKGKTITYFLNYLDN